MRANFYLRRRCLPRTVLKLDFTRLSFGTEKWITWHNYLADTKKKKSRSLGFELETQSTGVTNWIREHCTRIWRGLEPLSLQKETGRTTWGPPTRSSPRTGGPECSRDSNRCCLRWRTTCSSALPLCTTHPAARCGETSLARTRARTRKPGHEEKPGRLHNNDWWTAFEPRATQTHLCLVVSIFEVSIQIINCGLSINFPYRPLEKGSVLDCAGLSTAG